MHSRIFLRKTVLKPTGGTGSRAALRLMLNLLAAVRPGFFSNNDLSVISCVRRATLSQAICVKLERAICHAIWRPARLAVRFQSLVNAGPTTNGMC